MYDVFVSSLSIKGGRGWGREKPNKSYYILALCTLNIFPSVYLARKKKEETNRIVIKKGEKKKERQAKGGGDSYPHLLKLACWDAEWVWKEHWGTVVRAGAASCTGEPGVLPVQTASTVDAVR